jgi:hypothetical protein
MAGTFGVTADTLGTDWTVHPEVQRKVITVKRADLVVVRGIGVGAGFVAVPPDQAAEAEAMREQLEALNAHVHCCALAACRPLRSIYTPCS